MRGDLIPEQRRRALLALLEAEGVVPLRRAADEFGVSRMTVRRDIAQLERDGLATAVAGGVRLGGHQPPVERGEREGLGVAEKAAIAAAAESMVEDGMTVYLDAGTTCQALATALTGRSGLTVVTNDLHSALELASSGARVIHTGGEVDPASGSSADQFAVRTVGRLLVDLCFMSTGAWDLASGVTTPVLAKAELKIAAAASATTTVLLADGSKYGARSRFAVMPLNELDAVITDDSIDARTRRRLVHAGVRATFASSTGTRPAGVGPARGQ